MRAQRELTPRRKKLWAGAALVVFLLLAALVCRYVGVPMLRFAAEPEKFRLWIQAHGLWGELAYMGMVALQILVAVIPGEPLEIAGGYAFGVLKGTTLCMLAAGAGSAIVLLLSRRFGTRLAELFFTKEKLASLRFLKSSPKKTLLLLLIFMLPGTPKDLICFYAGLTDIKLPALLIICSLGRFPSIITSALGGDALGTKSYLFAGAVFIATLAVSAAGLMIYNRVCRKNEPPESDPVPELHPAGDWTEEDDSSDMDRRHSA